MSSDWFHPGPDPHDGEQLCQQPILVGIIALIPPAQVKERKQTRKERGEIDGSNRVGFQPSSVLYLLNACSLKQQVSSSVVVLVEREKIQDSQKLLD